MPRRCICFALALIAVAAFTAAAGLAQGVPPVPAGKCQDSAAPPCELPAAPPAPPAPPAASAKLPKTPRQQAAPGPTTTLKANAQLVVVDVVVTDSKQNPVHNLKAADFTLIEGGSPQNITGFEEHVAMPPEQTAKLVPVRPLPPGFFTNFTPTPPGSAVNVLLLDQLNTPMKDQAYMMSQLREFLKNMPVGTRIAIFALNDQLIMLQGVTSDLAQLKAVVERPNLGSSMLLGDSAGHMDDVGNGGTQTGSEVLTGIAGLDITQIITSLKLVEAMMAADATMDRAKQTLDAMNQIAHYLAGIPGRKNLIWFSGSFPLTIFPDSDISHPFTVVAGADEEFRETTDLLGRAEVAVYPVDARGLQTLSTAITRDSSATTSTGPGLTTAKNKLFQDNANEHATMSQMANATGGHAYIDNNGLSEAVGKAIENGSSYYTLSYTPTNSKWNGEFRKIQVKLAEKGVTATYRNGYFADDPNARPQRGAAPVAVAGGAPSTLTRAMLRGAPAATEILLKLRVQPVNDAIEQTVAPGNTFNADAADRVKVRGPFRRYAIDIAVDARDVHITPTPDGHYQFAAEVVTFVYDPNGTLINSAVIKARGNLSASAYANMLHVGLPFHQEISVPVTGEYYLRTAVHDVETDRIGAVEVPVAAVARLTPLSAAGAAATKPPGAAPRQ